MVAICLSLNVGVGTKLIQLNTVNIMVADALAHCVPRTSVPITFTS